MCAVAKNLIVRAAREGGRFTAAPRADDEPDRQHDLDQLLTHAVPVDEQVERRLIRRQVVDDVLAALTRLPRSQSRALGLVYGQGMSYAGAAETMGVAEGTLSPRLQRGRSKLRDSLAHWRGRGVRRGRYRRRGRRRRLGVVAATRRCRLRASNAE